MKMPSWLICSLAYGNYVDNFVAYTTIVQGISLNFELFQVIKNGPFRSGVVQCDIWEPYGMSKVSNRVMAFILRL